MNKLAIFVAVTLGIGFGLSSPTLAANDAPLTENWAPSEWGPDDKVGSVNRTTPEMVLKAVELVKQGKVATLGKVYQKDIPTFGGRAWRMVIPGLPTGGPFGPAELYYTDEYLAAEIGQIGTQFDGPGHIGIGTSKGLFYYNGHFAEDPDVGSYGMGPLGVEHVAEIGFVCRGVLLDAVADHGGPLPIPVENNMSDPGIVTAEDVKRIVERQGLEPIGEGDCVFLYTGHGDLWHPKLWDTYDAAEKARRVEAFNAGEPGFGVSACDYIAERKIILWASDTWGSEAVGKGFGGENPQPFECHFKMLTQRGIWNIENLDFSQLVADKAYEFLFVWSPLKIKGATGSPGNPIALY